MKKSPALTYKDLEKDKTPSEFLRNKLKLISFNAKSDFAAKFPHAHKFFANNGIDLGRIREHSARLISARSIVSTLLFSSPAGISFTQIPKEIIRNDDFKGDNKTNGLEKEFMKESLSSVLPKNPRPLSPMEEQFVENIVKDYSGITIKGNLEGEHLNTNYGFIGYEQHLQRFPGDVLSGHGSAEIVRAGMAPGRGAWGYFAKSKSDLTPQLSDIEKWYVVVQTLYLPDWNTRSKYLKDWYKYRKVVVLNTENGNAVVGAIADSGPAAWTGKQFGDSPEVMNELGSLKYKKGKVLVFFVDDPENKIPLGPVVYASK